jgi:chromosome partitioning protein
MGKTIVIANRKGGCGKSMTATSLAVGLARQGQRVLVIDADPQHSLSLSLGVSESEKLPVTLATVMSNIVNEVDFSPLDGIIRHSEGVAILPANDSLAGLELALVQVLGREMVLRRYIEKVKQEFDSIIIDTSPSLGLLTINALAAADSVIIPVTPKFLDAKGLELLLKTIARIKGQINPALEIGGILLTMVDKRINFTKNIISSIETAYGENIHIFTECIPRSVRAAETSATGSSIFTYDPNGKIATAYLALVGEVMCVA